jgi:hypothetical protein
MIITLIEAQGVKARVPVEEPFAPTAQAFSTLQVAVQLAIRNRA